MPLASVDRSVHFLLARVLAATVDRATDGTKPNKKLHHSAFTVGHHEPMAFWLSQTSKVNGRRSGPDETLAEWPQSWTDWPAFK